MAVSHRPVGMLVLQDVRLAGPDRSLLGTFANQAALAVDRAQLREQALRARLLEEIDRWRSALDGRRLARPAHPAGLHQDGRVEPAPGRGPPLEPRDRAELLELIELQSDRLARLVTNLLDMTRIEAGALELRPTTDRASASWSTRRWRSLGGIVRPDGSRSSVPRTCPCSTSTTCS